MIRYYKYLLPFLLVSYLFGHNSRTKPYDIIKYDLRLNVDMNKGSLKGSNTVFFVTDTTLKHIVLHSHGLKILHVTNNDLDLNFKVQNGEEKLVINGNFTPGDTLSIKIDFEYDDKFVRTAERKGFYYFKKGDDILENIAYTMSEPSDARCWFPCWDEPNDKVLTDLHVRVNKEYTVASNGLLLDTFQDTDSTKIFHWKTNYPISSYLISMAISKYSHFSDYYCKLSNPKDCLDLSYYIWKIDSAGVMFNAFKAFISVPKMIEVYSGLFGEYPFEKYGMVAVYPFNYGGEEHQSMTSIHRYWLFGEEMGIAHELAHQWWGDLVTCATWKDIWLNESFATYSEYLWLESKTKDPKELKNKIESYERYTSEWSKAIYDPEGQGVKLFSGIEYQKGALVLHTLRSIIGDSLFFRILTEYRAKYEYNYADTKDFIELVNSVTGNDYNWFFKEYIYGKGWPKISYSWHYDDVEKTVKVKLEQTQSKEFPTYRLPVEIRIISNTPQTEQVIMNGKSRKQEFSFAMAEKPDSIQINPDKKIFMQTYLLK